MALPWILLVTSLLPSRPLPMRNLSSVYSLFPTNSSATIPQFGLHILGDSSPAIFELVPAVVGGGVLVFFRVDSGHNN
jgi:hypothetical protein